MPKRHIKLLLQAKVLVAFIILLFLVFCSCQSPDNRRESFAMTAGGVPKNIIFILLDDYGYEVPKVDGGSSYSTPNLDSLGANGMRFTQCHSSPLCSPSRTALLTGKYNFRNYVDWGHLDPSNKTFANMFHDAGYKTAIYGKWQLGGADSGIHAFGFDQYCAWNATGAASDKGSRYKDPQIYTNATLSVFQGAYGDDVFTDSTINFIQQNKDNRFFIYCALVETHDPWCPTPDDSNYLTWSGWATKQSDTTYYPSMTKYSDKKIGQIINKVKQLGLDSNTIIIVCGDNGTGHKVVSILNGQPYAGGKGEVNEHGTHVPLIVWGAGIPIGIDTSLICFQDFLPTFANLANIQVPTTYGILDGISFAPQAKGFTPSSKHDWIYNYYIPLEGGSKDTSTQEWVQDYNYKMYYNHTTQKYTFSDLNDSVLTNLTPEQSVIKKKYKNIILTIKN